MLEQLAIHRQKTNLDLNLTRYTKIDSKWIINLNVKHETVTLLEENIEKNVCNPGLGRSM